MVGSPTSGALPERIADVPSEARVLDVCMAFRLGWMMGLLYARRIPTRPQPHGVAPIRLPANGGLRAAEQIASDLAAINAATRALARATQDRAATELPSTAEAEAQLAGIGTHGTPERLRISIFELHLKLLQTLTSADAQLGDVYDMGRVLAEMSRLPMGRQLERLAPRLTKRLRPVRQTAVTGSADSPPSAPELHTAWLKEIFDRHRIESLAARLEDLSSALPEHAGRAVAYSLMRFARQVQDAVKSTPAALNWDWTQTTLERQGGIWRSLLSGDKNAHDMLTPDSYVAIARRWFVSSRSLLGAYLRLFWLPLLLVLLLLAIAVSAAAIGSTAGGAVAGIVAALAALGLGTRGTQATLGQVTGKLARPLWDGQVEDVLAETITQEIAFVAPASETSRNRYSRFRVGKP